MPELELGDGHLNSLGTTAKTIFDDSIPSQKEEEEEILKDIFDQYNIESIKDTMDEKSEIPESIYFFYGGQSEQFVQALEFIGLSPINREFAAFLISDLGLKTMTQKKVVFMLNPVKSFMIITILEKICIIFCCLNKMMK